MDREKHEENRVGWNEGAAAYEEDLEERIAFLRAGGTNFVNAERPYLHDLGAWCRRAVHLQCAGGTDTLSLLNLGAQEVVGIDISDRMIEVARQKSAALDADARWFRCDLVDTPRELDGSADLVYTGRGALCWLSDLDAWADVVYRLLKPGGKLYVFEGHPIMNIWRLEEPTWQLDPLYGDYFGKGPISEKGWPSTYIGDLGKPAEEHATKHEWPHTLGDIVNAVLGSGLRLLKLEEHPDSYWDMMPKMNPPELEKLPQTFSLLAEKRI